MAEPFLDRDLRVTPIDAFIDPPQPVDRAIITHGHGDHARSRPRRGARHPRHHRHHEDPLRRGLPPAVPGAALRRAARQSTASPSRFIPPATSSARRRCCWSTAASASSSPATTSGSHDRTAQPFELVQCDLLVTEATFGLPVFQHPDPHGRDRPPAPLGRASIPSAPTSSAAMRSARRSA